MLQTPIFQDVAMEIRTNSEVAQIFGQAAERYDVLSNAYTMRRRAVALAAYVRGVTVEVGGGTAAVISALQDRSNSFHSDIALPMCKVARSKILRPTACFDAEQIPLADACVDTVVSAEMIYYLRRPNCMVGEAFRILRPGGRLVLSTTNPVMTWLERGRSLLRRIGVPGTFFDDGSPRFLTLSRLTSLLKEAGYEVEVTRGIVPIPFAFCDPINRLLEITPMQQLGLFLVIVARKPG